MGTRGPAPKPPELKALEGGRSHRPINLDQTFRPKVGLPDPPKYLSKEARKAWKRLSVELLEYNLLSKVDRDAFAMLCQTIGRLEQIETSINGRMALLASEQKDVIDALFEATPKGMKVQHPVYQVLNREQAKLNSLLAEFGLTPAQRARVTTAIRAQASLFDVNADNPQTPPTDPSAPKGFAEFK